jgi:hypothetical protein
MDIDPMWEFTRGWWKWGSLKLHNREGTSDDAWPPPGRGALAERGMLRGL